MKSKIGDPQPPIPTAPPASTMAESLQGHATTDHSRGPISDKSARWVASQLFSFARCYLGWWRSLVAFMPTSQPRNKESPQPHHVIEERDTSVSQHLSLVPL